MTSAEIDVPNERFAAFRNRAFLYYWAARLSVSFATQIVSVAVGWQIYDLTRDPFHLGLVGIIQFAPALLLVLVTGAAADRFGRRVIMGIATVLEATCALALLLLTIRGLTGPEEVFVILAVFGVARAFFQPASASLIANLVPPAEFARAVAWNSTAWQIATIVGPVAGGLLYGVSPQAAYCTAMVMMALGAGFIFCIASPKQIVEAENNRTLSSLFDGFRYIWREKVVFGAISLDLFAVLVSGAIALMPVYARDILHLGPWGLGLLRAAPGIGALGVAVWLTGHPVRDHAGIIMFVFVAIYGLFTMLFGVSTLTWLSILALIGIGAADMISVYIRETLIQLWTPDRVRGRVNAVNMVFIGASNELGEFRAGTMAALIGTVPAVVAGGVGAIAIAGIWAWMFPGLRKARHLNGRV